MLENAKLHIQNFLNTRTGMVVAVAAIAFSVIVLLDKLVNRGRTGN